MIGTATAGPEARAGTPDQTASDDEPRPAVAQYMAASHGIPLHTGTPPDIVGRLGRRQQNLLAGVLRGVPVIHDGEATLLPPADIQQALARFRPSAPTDELEALANQFRPRLLEALVGPEARRSGYIRGLPPDVLPHLLSAADRGVRRPIVLRVVYGATRRLPLRALSYVIPAVQMAERLARATHRTPHLEIVLMGDLGASVNGLPRDEVAAELTLLGRVLAQLLPLLGVKTGFAVRADRRAEVSEYLTRLVRQLGTEARSEVLRLLAGRGGSRSEQQTLRYAAAHALLHDLDGIPLSTEYGEAPPEDAVRIDVGGLQERHFHRVRTLFARERERDSVPSSPLVLTRHSVPPYTMARDGDIALRDFLAGTAPQEAVLPSAVRHDLRYLWLHLDPEQVAAAV